MSGFGLRNLASHVVINIQILGGSKEFQKNVSHNGDLECHPQTKRRFYCTGTDLGL